MVVLYDSAGPGNSNITNATGAPATFNYPLNPGQRVWIGLASNQVPGIASGPAVVFYVNGANPQVITLPYGSVAGPIQVQGTVLSASIPGSGGSQNTLNVRVIVAEDEGSVESVLQSVGISTSNTSQKVIVAVGITHTGPTTVFTGPTGFRAVLLRLTVYDGTSGDTLTLVVESSNASSTVTDYVTPRVDGFTFGSGGICDVGFGPGNDIQLLGPIILYPGDTLQGTCVDDTANVSAEFMLVPL